MAQPPPQPPSPSGSQSGAQAPPDTDKHQDRLITWRSAVLSAAVVLLAGLVGAASSYVVADRQIESAEKQARTEFLRTQRQAAYADLMNHSELAARVFVEFRSFLLLDPEEVSEARGRLVPLVQDVESDVIRIRLIGSSVVAERALEYYDSWQDAYEAISLLGGCLIVERDNVDPLACESRHVDVDTVYETQEGLRNDFLNAARVDLGATD